MKMSVATHIARALPNSSSSCTIFLRRLDKSLPLVVLGKLDASRPSTELKEEPRQFDKSDDFLARFRDHIHSLLFFGEELSSQAD